MKELSIEEKAKAYDEALERASKLRVQNPFDTVSQMMEHVFPELKESEDKKWIPKEIAKYLKEKGDFRSCWIAWLEKQGDKVSAIEGFETEFERQVSGLIASAINKEHEYNQGYVKWTAIALLNYAKHELEKQDEQNPVVTPKFRIGDIITPKGKKEYYTIIDIVDGWYEFREKHVNGGIPIHYQFGWELVEQKPTDKVEPKFKVGDTIKEKETGNVFYVNSVEDFGYTLHYKNCNANGCTISFKYEDNYELVEQKPVDKVEPKFEVGDWISGYYTNYKVLSVNNDGYVVEDVDGNKINILFENEKFHHPWTIQDAKDGDVLHCWIDGDEFVLIYKGIKDGYITTYGHLYQRFKLFAEEPTTMFCRTIQGHFTPATKEQRDLLFQKMNEAGWEWDAEKKELMRIEKKPVEWSEEDEKNLDTALNMIEWYAGKDEGKCRIVSDWLKSLKDRVQPQPRQEWSQNDIDMIDWLIRCCEKEHKELCNDKYGHQDIVSDLKRDCRKKWNWLELLKNKVVPQSHWKPSDEQMVALDGICSYIRNQADWEISQDMVSDLYKLSEQLKKLKDEK